ncbi:hypothetical protein L596_025849 [Steinernema carpocapsae]|uniref:Uncharacterized protein n=1 Tax=Steinernema carpocapsae TaxID=34508 RepID=A0A4U5M928_STECR|nr:hypothetical protein L596_025849 [Steinernema carpocapsae]
MEPTMKPENRELAIELIVGFVVLVIFLLCVSAGGVVYCFYLKHKDKKKTQIQQVTVQNPSEVSVQSVQQSAVSVKNSEKQSAASGKEAAPVPAVVAAPANQP